MTSTLQLAHPEYDHIFAIGDVAHTTAIKAGHVGYWQAGVAVENIVKLLEGADRSKLKVYEPTKPMIKVTVGKVRVWNSENRDGILMTLDAAQGRGADVGRRRESPGDRDRGHARGSRCAEHVVLCGREDGRRAPVAIVVEHDSIHDSVTATTARSLLSLAALAAAFFGGRADAPSCRLLDCMEWRRESFHFAHLVGFSDDAEDSA